MQGFQYNIKTNDGRYTIYSPDDVNIDMITKDGTTGFLSSRQLSKEFKALLKGMGFKLNLYPAKQLLKVCGITKK